MLSADGFSKLFQAQGGKEHHRGRELLKWFMESRFATGVFGVDTRLHLQWYSYLTGLRAGSVPSPPLASSLPAPLAALAPLVAWPHWDPDPGTDLAKKQPEDQREAFFFLMEKDQFPEDAACLLALPMQARGEVGHVLRWVDGGAEGGDTAAWAGLCHPSSRCGIPQLLRSQCHSRFLLAEELLLTLCLG